MTESTREFSDTDDAQHSRTVTWHDAEFLRVVSDEEYVSVVWSTSLALGALVEAVKREADFSDAPAEVRYRNIDTGISEIPVDELLTNLERGADIVSAQVPFTNFWLWWAATNQVVAGAPQVFEASISYSRGELTNFDPDYLVRTGTPTIQAEARPVLDRFHRLDIF